MARGTEKKKQLLAVLAGLIVFLLGAGFANADVRGPLVDAIVVADEPAPAPVEDDGAADESSVVGALEADHTAPVEEEAKLEEEPEEVNEGPETPDPDADPADDQTTVGAVPPPDPAPADDTDTDDGKTSIPLPAVGDDTDEADETDAVEDDAEETQGDESADEDE